MAQNTKSLTSKWAKWLWALQIPVEGNEILPYWWIFVMKYLSDTPPKINMEPKNEGLEDEFPFQFGDFQVPC